MEIEVGEYVRLARNQGINKIVEINEEDEEYVLDWCIADEWGEETCCLYESQIKEEILKHSKNIIDLIEVGDYVNGELVSAIYDENEEDEQIQIETNNQGKYIYYINDDIESIVTKEQFKNIEYRLE